MMLKFGGMYRHDSALLCRQYIGSEQNRKLSQKDVHRDQVLARIKKRYGCTSRSALLARRDQMDERQEKIKKKRAERKQQLQLEQQFLDSLKYEQAVTQNVLSSNKNMSVAVNR